LASQEGRASWSYSHDYQSPACSVFVLPSVRFFFVDVLKPKFHIGRQL
jgi:hypothetical protein